MYQHLDSLTAQMDRVWFFKDLSPLKPEELDLVTNRWPNLPADYISFLRERGAGPIEDGFHFNLLRMPLDASTEVFKDRLILERGAKGDVVIFGHDQAHSSYGFDTGNQNALVEVDEYRQVNAIPATFSQFLERLVTEYPQLPRGET
jgi:hypothetical protein